MAESVKAGLTLCASPSGKLAVMRAGSLSLGFLIGDMGIVIAAVASCHRCQVLGWCLVCQECTRVCCHSPEPVIPELGQLCTQCGPLRGGFSPPDGEQPFPSLFPHGVKCSLALYDLF